jgi:hypothetical protein
MEADRIGPECLDRQVAPAKVGTQSLCDWCECRRLAERRPSASQDRDVALARKTVGLEHEAGFPDACLSNEEDGAAVAIRDPVEGARDGCKFVCASYGYG